MLCYTLEGRRSGEKGCEVNHLLGGIRRLVLGAAVAGAAVFAVLLTGVLPARAAVELADFHVDFYGDHAVITWVTGSELGTVGFNLHRAETPDLSSAYQVNDQLIEASRNPTGDFYQYTDGENVVPGATYYWLEIIDQDGDKVFGPEPEPGPTPSPTSTPAGQPSATPTPTQTKTPIPTSTTVPTVNPSATATAVPTSTPSVTPATTVVSPPSPAASPSAGTAPGLSPTATPEGVAEPISSPGVAATEAMPTATPMGGAGTSETATATTVAWGGTSEPDASGGSPVRFHWPTIRPSTILFLISMTSLLGAMLLGVALTLVRKLSL